MLQADALEILKTGKNVFLTGSPGSGKTFVINQYINYLQSHNILPTVTASTGIAATHSRGTTVHSFFGLGTNTFLSEELLDKILTKEKVVKRVREMKVLIVDEISMLEGGLLDMIDQVCKAIKGNQKSFGGVQVVFVGDFFQLPPVASFGNSKKFAFQSNSFKEAKTMTCYLEEQHRQEDGLLLDILLAIRQKKINREHIDLLNARINFTEKVLQKEDFSAPRLFTHNKNVDEINLKELEKLQGEKRIYLMKTFGKKYILDSLIKSCLAPFELVLKKGAKVMCIKNSPEKGFFNGTLAEVYSFSENSIQIKTENGKIINLEEAEWSVEEDGKVIAKIMQFPIRLAWAITIHKSQGMSLSEAFMDLSQTFEYGQGYVALSRVSSLEGLYLGGFSNLALSVDDAVFNFDLKLKDHSKEVLIRFKNSDFSKISAMQQDFILSCGGDTNSDETRIQKTDSFQGFKLPKKDTLQETKDHILEGFSLKDIAKKRSLTFATILNHAEDLLEKGDLEKDDIINSLPKSFQNIPAEIKKAFKKLGTNKLVPVFQELKEEYSYEELRMYRLIL
jgi:ATP-dependent DNA helicase PIF1